ncbi:hypothetical protein Ddye_010734 [Dipteronia dyeriana]|uniref:CW-type domain-containing protein n=1 Tax=Dipteronia dyeriana TaxID=168575 RepID=A0AAD9XE93_9ROSI|nr:hypothetical protein Ddye_010734 [Dipteronia dyeriana]
MRLGRDALVLTQTADSRSIAFLSQSLNEGTDNLEIPIVSYYRKGQFMELDTSVQSEATAKHNLKAIKEFSPFDKYMIGEKAGLFRDTSTGTQTFIWNLDKWGSNYSLKCHKGLDGGSSFHKGDILIRSMRIRSRPGQISQKVKSRLLAKSLNKTHVKTGTIMEKLVQLTLGRCQLEWEHMNCGIFLYWHGRLIEDGGNGRVWVHNNKQGFQDCEPYARLEEWLGKVADEYCDNNFDQLELKKGNDRCKPDQEWVQCNKCRKWRMLSSDFDPKTLPLEWYLYSCFVTYFDGRCETPEQKVERGVITVSTKRTGYVTPDKCRRYREWRSQIGRLDDKGCLGLDRNPNDQNGSPPMKRMRKGLPRTCKKV